MNIINIRSIWTSLIQMNYKMNFIVTIKLRPFSQNSFLRFNFISETSIGNFLTNFISTSSLDLSIRQKIATRTVTISKHSTFDSVEMTESVVKIGSIGSRSRRMLEKKRSVPFSSALLAKGDRDPGKDLRNGWWSTKRAIGDRSRRNRSNDEAIILRANKHYCQRDAWQKTAEPIAKFRALLNRV